MSPKNSRGGFTLIELLFVIFIIGILAAIILANFGPARKQARDARRISDVSQIQVALEGYFENPADAVPGNNGKSYPPYVASVLGDGNNNPVLPCRPTSQAPFAQGGLNCLTAVSGNSNVPYLPTVPQDPSSGLSYDYYSCDPGATDKSCENTDLNAYYQHYCIGANLENYSAGDAAELAANTSCSGVTWCPYTTNYSQKNNGSAVPTYKLDNYVVCR